MGIKKKISSFFRRKRKVKQLEKRFNDLIPKQLKYIDRTPIHFCSSSNPMVSIVIPFYNQEIYTWNCLQYLSKNLTEKYPYEILLIDDNSKESYDFSSIDGINIIKNEVNIGFLKNVNKGIQLAKGDYIYLLNNDTEVYENFLEELFYVFENFENVGAVGSMLINPDQSLQEAGCVFMHHYTIHQIVRKRKPFYPDVNYIRKVDYCSGCSLLFKKYKDNGSMNLLDEQYIPAYFEETDLCFDMKYNQNKHIFYTPFSKVLHYNGITYNSKTKENQESQNRKELLFKANKEKFYTKWKNEIDAIQSKSVEERIVEICNDKSIVFFNDTIPEFDKDSGSNRLMEIMKVFVRLGFNVTLISKEIYLDNRYISYYQHLGIHVFYEYKSNKDYTYFIKRNCTQSNYVWFYGPNTHDRYYKKIKKLFVKAKFIYDMVDIHHLRYQRALEFDKKNKTIARELKKYCKIELDAAQVSDYVITISDSEKNYMNKFVPNEKLLTISNIHYTKVAKDDLPNFNNRNDIIFIGSTHHPNIEALLWLHKEIMPLVWQVNPSIKVNIIGNINTMMSHLDDERIVFHGYLDKVDDYFLNAKLMVAPLLIGAGVKGKIGQAFEYYLPVVTTTIGAEGMFLENNQNVLIADSAEDFANAILELYNNKEKWNLLSNNSENSLHPFSKEKVIDVIHSYFK